MATAATPLISGSTSTDYQAMQPNTTPNETVIKTDKFVRFGDCILNLKGISEVKFEESFCRAFWSCSRLELTYTSPEKRTQMLEIGEPGVAHLACQKIRSAIRSFAPPPQQEMTTDKLQDKSIKYGKYKIRLDGISSVVHHENLCCPDIQVIYDSPEKLEETFKFGWGDMYSARRTLDELELALNP